MRRFLVTILAALTLAPALAGQEISAADLDKRRAVLRKVLDEQWDYNLLTSPEFASILGDKRFNDKLTDPSEAEVYRELEQSKKFLRRFEAIGTAGFSDQEKLNRDLMIRLLRNGVADARFKAWRMPVSQMGGIQLNYAQLPSYLTFDKVKDYDDFIARMRQYPRVFDATISNMRKGIAAKLTQPKFLIPKIAEQAESLAAGEAEQSPFAQALSKFPASISESERLRIRAEFLDAIRTAVMPAYAKFARFIRDEYAPAGRNDAGIWSLPQGKARYANLVARMTTTNLTPDEIHETGLREVARIEGEMRAIAGKLGYTDLKAFNKFVDANQDLRARSRQQILDIYRVYEDQMYAKLPQLFGRLPKAKLEVIATESYREKTAAAADYDQGALDGSRPGRINVNTSDPASRKTIFMESTAYHEGVPGHHMQISIAQELTDVPEFRKQGNETAYVEGWALYSERLGKEVGFYQDPYNDYGRLNDEMLRAIRLVVDTGLHSKRWTREQVVQFFHDHSATDEVEVQSETDRYIVVPGQALGYKIGQLKILELRERAHRELGPRFDIRDFHDQILGAGSLPLSFLEQRIDSWIAAKKKSQG